MSNKSIRNLEDMLIATLNSALDVDIEVKRLIVTNILNLIKVQADDAILQEIQEEQKDAEST